MMNTDKEPIYLDYQATTPTDPRVVAAMSPWFFDAFGNAHSSSHQQGAAAAAAVEKARAQVAALIGADPREIIFTSGATESNNLAIKGLLGFCLAHPRKNPDRPPHIITTAFEHKCVLESALAMAASGAEVTCLPPSRDGFVTAADVQNALREETVLVSVIAAHNEVGTIQPVAEIGALCAQADVVFHTDAAQAAGKIPLDVAAMRIGLMSLSAHKLYGPKGIGALFVRRRPRVRLTPLLSGGGQERGLRSGTLPVPLCVGFGAAAELAMAEMDTEARTLAKKRDHLRRLLRHGSSDFPNPMVENAAKGPHLPHSLNIAFPGLQAVDLIAHLNNHVSVSSGSACTSAAVEPSYALKAMGLTDALAAASLRLSVGRFTEDRQIEKAAADILETASLCYNEDLSSPSGAAGPDQ